MDPDLMGYLAGLFPTPTGFGGLPGATPGLDPNSVSFNGPGAEQPMGAQTPPATPQPAAPITVGGSPQGGSLGEQINKTPLQGTNPLVNALKSVTVPKPPEPQKVTTPHLPAQPAIRGGNLQAMLQALNLPAAQMQEQYKLPSTLAGALGLR